jgi:hypothetical protein
VHDPRTPLLSKLLPWLVLAYALSPLDLIPDFIPVLGFLDDMLLLPLGLWLSFKLIPAEVGWGWCVDMGMLSTVRASGKEQQSTDARLKAAAAYLAHVS